MISNNPKQETVAVVVRVKEMNEDGLAVLRRGQGRKCEVRVYFPPERIVKQIRPIKEYVSMWSRFLNYFGLKNNKPSVS